MEWLNVVTKGISPKQGLTSAKDLTISLSVDRDSQTIEQTILTNLIYEP